MQAKIRPKEILRRRNLRLKMLAVAVVLAGASYVAYWWSVHRDWVTTDDAFVAGHLISLKAQTAGTVTEILAEDTQQVTRGDVLVRLDGTHSQIALRLAEAELAETVRNWFSLNAKVETLQQRIAAKQASLTQIQHDLNRFTAAARDGAVSEQQLQNARDKRRELEAEINVIRAELAGVEAQLQNNGIDHHPAVEKAKNRLRQAFLDYQRRNVVAPVSGYVARRKVQIGDYLNSGAPLLAIVPLDQLWVEANLLETQIGSVRPGQTAEIRVDAYSEQRLYHGQVQGLAPGTGSRFALLPTDNATGNFIHIAERLQVRIALDPKELLQQPLQPGLSTVTRIHISDAGLPALSSTVAVEGEAYKTDVYDHELEGAEPMIQRIIDANTP